MFLMSNFKKIIEVLNDLIKINREREEGYVKAGRELTPAEHNLRGIFERKAQESRNNVVQLQYKADEVGAPAQDEPSTNSITGAIYEAWCELKKVFSGNDTNSILKCRESDEEAVQKQSIDASREEIKMLAGSE
jgi:uncharacterized protein (TIGR02284 family)